MKRLLLLIFWLTSLSIIISAQYTWTIPSELAISLDKMNAEVIPPIDGSYKAYNPFENNTQNCHWAIRSRKDGLEVRYLLVPFSENQPISNYPGLAASRMAMHICSNEENSVITSRDLTDHEQEVLYNVDWGKVFIFPPKLDFSPYAYCKMVVLYKENQGLAYIFNLFDEPSQNIDNRLYTFRFKDEDY